MIKPSRQPYGFRDLLAYRKAEELQFECSRLTSLFPRSKTLSALADQMNRSARSTKQNIVEGWKRNSTKEYYDFLGFSIGSNTELEEDCNDIWKRMYAELMGIKGIMGVRGKDPSIPLTPLDPLYSFDIEKLPFYPLNKDLPAIVQLKLRAKELNFLLYKLQKSLENKMKQEKTLPAKDIARSFFDGMKKNQKIDEDFLIQNGLERLPSGRVVSKK